MLTHTGLARVLHCDICRKIKKSSVQPTACSLYSLIGVKLQSQQVSVFAVQPCHLGASFFFFSPPALQCLIQSGQLIQKFVAPSRKWRAGIAVSYTADWFPLLQLRRGGKTQSVYVVMRQNSFVLVLKPRVGPSIQVPSVGC